MAVATPSPRARRRPSPAALAFLAPAVIFLGVWIVYPTVRTVVRSFFGREGTDFVFLDNYRELFSEESLTTAIRNNLLWIAVVPALVTAIGLILAVLTERVSFKVAFRTVVFMPMAISMFAAGVIWHVMDDKDPDKGAINAAVGAVRNVFTEDGVLPRAKGSTAAITGSLDTGLVFKQDLAPGDTAGLGLTAIPPKDVPAGARQAVVPKAPGDDQISGVVWRDFKPGGGTPGEVETGEQGLPGISVELRDASSGKVVAKAKTGDDGTFTFDGVKEGSYRAAVASKTFAAPFDGVAWLGPKLILPAIMLAYIWVWAGFAMVIIAAGLAAIPREVLEAARTDGAGEWQVFRRVTAPLLAPVLSVVFVTMIINVLKVFDIVLAVAPQSTQDDANVIALAMWRTAFSGVSDFGLGSAIAVLLFVMVIPFLALNIRRFKREAI